MEDRWNRVRATQDSECMKDMCNRMHFHLTTYWRGTDRALFDFYTQLYCESDEELPFIVEQAQKTYPVKLSSPLEFDVVLCVSHANRMLVNRLQNEAKARIYERCYPTYHVEWSGEDIKGTTSQPQSMIIWPGIELIGCTRGLGKNTYGIVQGVVYTVKRVDEANLTLEMNEEYKKKDAIQDLEHSEDGDDFHEDDEKPSVHDVTLPLVDAPAVLRLTHAMCYFTMQGRTLRDRHILLLDTGHFHFSRRALIVGMSRATHGSYVHVATPEYEEFVTGRRRKHITRI